MHQNSPFSDKKHKKILGPQTTSLVGKGTPRLHATSRRLYRSSALWTVAATRLLSWTTLSTAHKKNINLTQQIKAASQFQTN